MQGRRAAQLAQEPGHFHQLSHGWQDGCAIAMGDGGDNEGNTTTSWVKCEGGTIRGNVQPADALRGGVATRGDATTSQDKREGGAMRGKAASSQSVERW